MNESTLERHNRMTCDHEDEQVFKAVRSDSRTVLTHSIKSVVYAGKHES